jgi:glucan phosphoethanolaminetransferase (alkaline phosphatase superfamily)
MSLSFRPKKDKIIPFLILVSFLLTFILSRCIVIFFPTLFLQVRGVHIHHFSYGILMLSMLGLVSLTTELSYSNRLRLSIPYGIALGLAYDEFAMWLRLDDVYYDRRSYDAILIIVLVLLNITYLSSFWRRWSYHLKRLFIVIVVTGPRDVMKLLWSWFD